MIIPLMVATSVLGPTDRNGTPVACNCDCIQVHVDVAVAVAVAGAVMVHCLNLMRILRLCYLL